MQQQVLYYERINKYTYFKVESCQLHDITAKKWTYMYIIYNVGGSKSFEQQLVYSFFLQVFWREKKKILKINRISIKKNAFSKLFQ